MRSTPWVGPLSLAESDRGGVGLAALLLLLAGGCADRSLTAFERTLAAQDSATAGLETWCARHQIADPPVIRAEQVKAAPLAPPPELRERLGTSTTPLGFRHVRLRCGDRVLSEAYNWYVADRLAPDMLRTLQTSDTPFGRVAAPLGFTRERLATSAGRAPGCPPGTVLSHTALLRLPGGAPLSGLIECYTAAVVRRK